MENSTLARIVELVKESQAKRSPYERFINRFARYYTPTGRSIQKPYSEGSEEYFNDLAYRYKHNELFSADSIHFVDSLRFTTPGGRTVYGGGGIMPDIFVPLDTTWISQYFREVSGRNILYRYTIRYADLHRGALDDRGFVLPAVAETDFDTVQLVDFKGNELPPDTEMDLEALRGFRRKFPALDDADAFRLRI